MSRRPERDERGSVAILFAAVALILFVLAAMVVDLGFARDTKQRSQTASDASALAAANALYPASGLCSNSASSTNGCVADAVAAAKAFAVVNFGVTDAQWATCPAAPSGMFVAPGSPTCISFDTLTKPTKVTAVMPIRNINTGLGALAEVDVIPISTDARASVGAGIQVNCSMCFLGNVDSGNADYTVDGGSIAVNGNVDLGAQGHMTGTNVAIAGIYNTGDGYSPKPVIKITPFSDPLAGLTLPSGKAGLTSQTGSPCAKGPGVYGDFSLSGTCTLPAGLYIITGKWDLKNNDKLTNAAGGVTLYFTCGTYTAPAACSSAGQAGGQLYGKNGEINLSARTVDPVKDFAIVYDRNNTSSVQLQGNGDGFMTGGVYAKRAALEYNGNSCFTITGGPIVVDSVIKANGNKSCVKILNAKTFNVATLPGDIALDE